MAGSMDELRLLVSASEYDQAIAAMDGKIKLLETDLDDYKSLLDDAVQIFGSNDSNFNEMKNVIKENLKKVQDQLGALKENRALLDKQRSALDELSADTGKLISEAAQTAQTAFSVVKSFGGLFD